MEKANHGEHGGHGEKQTTEDTEDTEKTKPQRGIAATKQAWRLWSRGQRAPVAA